MNNFFVTHEKKDCNGCGMCELICPQKAIKMLMDGEGFLYPNIEKEKCINCGLCKNRCSNNINKIKNDEDTYIAISKDKNILKGSSSGGMFFHIAKYIIDKKGVVFGVTFDENLNAHHEYIDNIEGIKKFQGSKYVRSDLNNAYLNVEKFLKNDRYVLFTGTPCQCEGLRKYLNKSYNKLITCEIVCHANPSPKVFKLYIENLEKIKKSKVENIYFRSKENGWRNQTPIIEYEDGSKEEENSYFNAFVNEMINRPSCYDCRFCSEMRYSDFSIADFWGIEKIDDTIKDNDTGISLLNVNTQNGKYILEYIKKYLILKKVNTKEAFSLNHHTNVPVHRNRNKFFKGVCSGKINESNIIFYLNKYVKKPLYRRILSRVKKYFNDILSQ